eukprot:2562798-Prymnesium_polylepis.3
MHPSHERYASHLSSPSRLPRTVSSRHRRRCSMRRGPLFQLNQSLVKVGRFGASSGQTNSECSGQCSLGHYCEEGSTSNTSGVCRERFPHSHMHVAPYSAIGIQGCYDSLLTSTDRIAPCACLQPREDTTTGVAA